MLNIPDEVKALFSSDTVHKNFHVRFPNGEYTDLNNENILSESVSFTESLCSQQYFKFGLAEASQLEFTAIGIPNVRGAYIECAIEIDCTRLGAAWAAAHPVDASLPFLTPQTCTYNAKMYYRVPYGLFKVDTCPRDKGVMYQRKITAYTDTVNSSNNTSVQDSFEALKESTFIPFEKVYQPDVYQLFAAIVNKKSFFNSPEWATTEIQPDGGGGVIPSYEKTATVYLLNDATAYQMRLTSNYYYYQNILDNDLGSIETDRDIQTDRTEVWNYIKNSCGIDWEATISGTDYDNANEFIDAFLEQRFFFPTLMYSYLGNKSGYANLLKIPDTKLSSVFYPHVGKTNFTYNYMLFPIGDYLLRIGNYPYKVDEHFNHATGQKVYRHRLTGANLFDGIISRFESTLNQSVYFSSLGKSVTAYSFANSYSMIDYIKGQLEICGWFLKPDRNGSLNFFQMAENPTAIPVPTSDWAEFWWDETPVEAIGKVKVIYNKDKEEQQQTFDIGDGNSIYTIDNNEVLKSAQFDSAIMRSILLTYFAPNASVVNFTPVELSMRGLPYLESGDYIELTAEDGETVETYILSQTISGIQHLTADVTSTNGALLEVIENE